MSQDVVGGETGSTAVDARVGHVGSRIDLDDLTKRYRIGEVDVTALERINLHVDEAAFVAIVGPSGCGKTTLLNMIGALDVPTSGSVRVAGIDLDGASRADRSMLRRHSVSFIFQSFNLFPGLTALENVRFGADAARTTQPGERAHEALEQVGLADRQRHFPHQLSGGEQQRVAIARALATGNPILLADEPTGELDFRTGVQILGVLEEQARAGMTVLVVTHNREIARVADRVVELSSGRIVSDGPPPGGKADTRRSAMVTTAPASSGRLGWWLRWSWRDLRSRWIAVVAIALVLAIGTGVYAGLGSTAEWRRQSNDASFAALAMHDLRVTLSPGTFVEQDALVGAIASIDGAPSVDAVAERLVVDSQADTGTIGRGRVGVGARPARGHDVRIDAAGRRRLGP